MSRLFLLSATLLLLLALHGCATKTYGRQGTLTSYEKDTMTCREIDLELAKNRGFVDDVNKESEFGGRDFLALFGDFGIGNNLARIAALESANKRFEQLNELRSDKKCKRERAGSVG